MKMEINRRRTKFRLIETLQPETKANADTGEISILGARVLNIDRGAEIIRPGSYAPHLAGFSKTGKVLIDHYASVRQIAAKVFRSYESPAGLVIDAKFTGDELGQWARKRAAEGSIDTVSIGHYVHKWIDGVKEAEVRKLWDEFEYQPSPYDLKMLARGPVRILTELEPVEVSFVAIPMNPEARILEVKSLANEIETKKGAILNRVNRGAVESIYALAKSILRSAKLMEEEVSQDAKKPSGPPEDKSAAIIAERKSRTDLLKLKLKLMALDSQIRRP